MNGKTNHSVLTKNEVNALLFNKDKIIPLAPKLKSKDKPPKVSVFCECFLRLFQIDLAQHLQKEIHLTHVSTDDMKFNELKMILSHKKSMRLLEFSNSKIKTYGLLVFDNHFYSNPNLLKSLAEALEKALESLDKYSVHLLASDTHQLLETISSNEDMILMTYEIEHTPQTTISVILPSNLFKNDLSSESKMTLDLILDVPLKVTVELGRTKMKIQDVLKLARDSMILLPTLTKQPLAILANDELIAKGEIVVMNEKFAVRITEITSLEQRLEKLK